MIKLDDNGKALAREKIITLTVERRRKMKEIDREYQKEVARIQDMIDFGLAQRMAP